MDTALKFFDKPNALPGQRRPAAGLLFEPRVHNPQDCQAVHGDYSIWKHD